MGDKALEELKDLIKELEERLEDLENKGLPIYSVSQQLGKLRRVLRDLQNEH